MTKEVNKNKEEKIHYNKGLKIKITAKCVKYMHVDKALSECPEVIVFTKNVRKFDMTAFKDVDCSRFDFSTAINLERIGTKCFKGAKNIHWSNTLNCSNREPDSFEDALILDKEDTKLI